MDNIVKNVPYLFISKEIDIEKKQGIFNLYLLVYVDENEGFNTIQIKANTGGSITFAAVIKKEDRLNTSINVEDLGQRKFVCYKIPLSINPQIINPIQGGDWDRNIVEIQYTDTENFEFNFEITKDAATRVTSIFSKNIFQGHPQFTEKGGNIALDVPYVYLRRKKINIVEAGNENQVEIYQPRVLVPTKGEKARTSIINKSISSNGNCEGIIFTDSRPIHQDLKILNTDIINSDNSNFYDAAKVEGGFSGVVFTAREKDALDALQNFALSPQDGGNSLNYYLSMEFYPGRDYLNAEEAAKKTKKKEVKVSTRSADTFPNNIFQI